MSWIPGSHLNQYQLIQALGAGGMGEVWLATDSRLERRVAIKLLPTALTSDPARVRRFEQEARAASALNQPNVCTIHALEQTPDGQHFIVMEYVEGQTLRARLAQGRLPLRELVNVGVQMASALTAAHAAGVVHRDLKPENVMLRPDGLVKVLDFGLAKLVARESDPAAATRTTADTVAGTVLGTMLYMSPEQARGLPVDARTDVWSLGVVLYELVAGRPPFTGRTTSDIVAAILEDEAEPLARFAPDVPSELARIVGKTLRKDPEQRYQVMKDLLLDLEALRDEVAVRSSGSQAATAPGRARRLRIGTVVGSIAGLVVAGSAALWWYRQTVSQSPPSAAVSSAPVYRPLRRLTFDAGLQTDATFSPDGRSIAYASDRSGNFDIWVQSLDGGEPQQITRSPAPETQPAWSPDGTRIVFRSEREKGGLFRVPVQGGPETQLTSFGLNPVWSADASEILFRSGYDLFHTAIHTVSPGGGAAPRELARPFLLDAPWNWIAPHPDGRISAIGVHPQRGLGFYTVARDGSQAVASKFAKDLPLQETELGGVRRFQWSEAGTTLYVEGFVHDVRNVWRVRVDPETLEWVAAERLTTGSGPDVAATLFRGGQRLAFTVERPLVRLWTYPLDVTAGRIVGPAVPITGEDGLVSDAALSPDGRLVAYTMWRSGGNRFEMLLTDIDANKTELFAMNASAGAWSRVGRTLAYELFRPELPLPGESALALRELGGAERIIQPWTKESYVYVTDWTPDGASIVGSYQSPRMTGVAKLASWAVAASPAATHSILLEHPELSLWQGRMSPDGRWLAFVAASPRGDVVHTYIGRPGARPSDWIPVAQNHPWADKPRWSPNGRMLYFISNEGSSFFNLWATRFDPTRGQLAGAPFRVTRLDSPALFISPAAVGSEIGIATRRAVLTLTSVQGSIWMLENTDR